MPKKIKRQRKFRNWIFLLQIDLFVKMMFRSTTIHFVFKMIRKVSFLIRPNALSTLFSNWWRTVENNRISKIGYFLFLSMSVSDLICRLYVYTKNYYFAGKSNIFPHKIKPLTYGERSNQPYFPSFFRIIFCFIQQNKNIAF